MPDRAEALVDLRFETRADGETLVTALAQAAAEAARACRHEHRDRPGGIARLPLERTEASEGLVMEYAACARASGLGGGEAPLIGGGSDASTTGAMGIPSIDGLGPRGVRLPHERRANRNRDARAQGPGARTVSRESMKLRVVAARLGTVRTRACLALSRCSAALRGVAESSRRDAPHPRHAGRGRPRLAHVARKRAGFG